jgi:CheY-like chemotaxis protein
VISLCSEPAPVYAGHKQIEQILLSLLDSVRKAAVIDSQEVRTGIIDVTGDLCRRIFGAQPGFYVALSVDNKNDTRSGAHIRLDPGSLLADPLIGVTKEEESAAMGLSETHSAIAQCGGFLIGDRKSGFHVFLPCAIVPVDRDAGNRELSGGAGETILLVEDDPLIRELSRDMLERQGYRVILALDAKEAEQIGGNAGTFDLLITDATMPGISGAELSRRLRTSHPGLKVLFISGYTDHPMERDEAGSEGAAFLQKPFSADSLGRKIQQIFSGNS